MLKQNTLKGSFALCGKGLHTGLSLTVTFNPAKENTGYKIQRMAAGIIAAMPGIADLSPLYLACTVAAVAGGSTVCSHFNDSGFWLVKSLVGIDEKTNLKTWTIMETLVGVTGFIVAFIISFFA